ncbi:hypothetical protein, partial [Streptomonospora salina]
GPDTDADDGDGAFDDSFDDAEGLDPDSGAHAHGAAPAPGGILSAETFSIIGLMLVGALLSGWRATEVVPSLLAQTQEGVISGMMVAEGVVALLAVASGLISLTLAGAATRPWARWIATATVVVGALLFLVAAGAYLQVPEPQPQPQMPVPGA